MLETSIKVGEREIKLRPSHKAIFAIERESGLAVYDLCVGHNLKILEVVSILFNCAEAAGEKIKRDELAEMLMGNISPEVILKCDELLNSVFADPSEDDKKKAEQ